LLSEPARAAVVPTVEEQHEEAVHTVSSEQYAGDISRKCARLAALAAGGQAVRGAVSFKGQPMTPECVDAMIDADVEELYARYEARLGAAMSKSLGSSLLRMYASVASMLLPLH